MENVGMGNYALGSLGIIVSIILFLIGYRQTVGAKKERISSANTEIEEEERGQVYTFDNMSNDESIRRHERKWQDR